MLLKTIFGGAFALVMAVSPALACTGPEIFSDNFSSSDGPWDHTEGVNIGGGFAELKPGSGPAVMVYQSAQIKDFDVCADITYPQASNPDQAGAGGIIFWFTTDPVSVYIMATIPNGALGVVRNNKGRALLVSPFRKYDFIKTGTAKNTFRVSAKGGNVTVYANGQRAAAFRGQADEGFIGLYAEGPNAWKFSNFKLAEPQ